MVYNINMKIILPVKEIPIGSVVTKVNGTKRYEVNRVLKIYGDVAGVPKEIKLDINARFLIPMDGLTSINVIDGETEVVWDADCNQIQSYLYEKFHLDQK